MLNQYRETVEFLPKILPVLLLGFSILLAYFLLGLLSFRIALKIMRMKNIKIQEVSQENCWRVVGVIIFGFALWFIFSTIWSWIIWALIFLGRLYFS